MIIIFLVFGLVGLIFIGMIAKGIQSIVKNCSEISDGFLPNFLKFRAQHPGSFSEDGGFLACPHCRSNTVKTVESSPSYTKCELCGSKLWKICKDISRIMKNPTKLAKTQLKYRVAEKNKVKKREAKQNLTRQKEFMSRNKNNLR
jgi:hypothetical protein